MKRICYGFIGWIYKILPMLYCCHCSPERSFFIKNRQFPLCARCTGQLIGNILAFGLFPHGHPKIILLCLLLLPLILDGTIQMFSEYRSTNAKRLITGVLFGYALITIIMISLCKTWDLGQIAASYI